MRLITDEADAARDYYGTEKTSELQQALDSDYPAISLSRLEKSGLIEDAEQTLNVNTPDGFFAYILDLETRLKDTRAKLKEVEKERNQAALSVALRGRVA